MNGIPNCRTCDQHWYSGVTSECPRADCEFKRRFNESIAVVIPTRPPPPAPVKPAPPANLPPLPPVPPGYDRWEYRGESWSSGQYVQYAYHPSDLCSGWRVSTGIGCTAAEIGTHYLEAVREPAKEKPPFPGAKSDSIEGLANLDHFVSKAFTKSFAVGGSEPAKEPAGVESIATREWCVKSAEIEGEAEIGAGTPTGVDVPRLLALLKRARHFSDGMNLAAYEAIQEAICELEPNQPNDYPR